jgi:hypothetical protein
MHLVAGEAMDIARSKYKGEGEEKGKRKIDRWNNRCKKKKKKKNHVGEK